MLDGVTSELCSKIVSSEHFFSSASKKRDRSAHCCQALPFNCAALTLCMYVCTYVCMYVCTYVCMYLCMYSVGDINKLSQSSYVCAWFNVAKLVDCFFNSRAFKTGLPERMFSNQESQIWVNFVYLVFQCFIFWQFGLSYGHLVFFAAIWYILGSFGTF
jgi:hypothetical protein